MAKCNNIRFESALVVTLPNVLFLFPRLGLNIGLMPLSGLFQIIMANDIVSVKNRMSLVAGDPHVYYLGGSRSYQVSCCRSPEIVEEFSFESSFPNQT
jgi:hypothetical protein